MRSRDYRIFDTFLFGEDYVLFKKWFLPICAEISLYVCCANNCDCFYLWKHRLLLFRILVCDVSANKAIMGKAVIPPPPPPFNHQTSVLKMVSIDRTTGPVIIYDRGWGQRETTFTPFFFLTNVNQKNLFTQPCRGI